MTPRKTTLQSKRIITWEENIHLEVKMPFPSPVNPLMSKDLVAQKRELQNCAQGQLILPRRFVSPDLEAVLCCVGTALPPPSSHAAHLPGHLSPKRHVSSRVQQQGANQRSAYHCPARGFLQQQGGPPSYGQDL